MLGPWRSPAPLLLPKGPSFAHRAGRGILSSNDRPLRTSYRHQHSAQVRYHIAGWLKLRVWSSKYDTYFVSYLLFYKTYYITQRTHLTIYKYRLVTGAVGRLPPYPYICGWSGPDANGRQSTPQLGIQEFGGLALNHRIHLLEEAKVVGMNRVPGWSGNTDEDRTGTGIHCGRFQGCR